MANSVLSQALAEARRRGASPMETKALIEAGIVESGLTQLRGGDRDSTGFLQQRPSAGWGPVGESVATDTGQFLDHARQLRGRYSNAGDLAAAIQRPAAQYRGRYAQVSGQADSLLRRGGGVTPRRRTTDGRGGPSTAAAGMPESSTGQQLAALLLAQPSLEQPRPQSVGLTTPAFAAGAVTPQGAMTVRSAGPQQDSPGAALARALSAAAALGDGSDSSAATQPESGVRTPQGASPQGAGGRGRFKITGPNPGRLKPALVSFAQRVAGVYGRPLTGSDGTGHSYLTVNGNVSQHSTGNATDIPAAGKQLIAMGRAALIAAGMPRRKAMAQTGGLFNFPHGVQVIFNTHEGGDHTNHLHISHG